MRKREREERGERESEKSSSRKKISAAAERKDFI
jgi:hypothetical protein